MKSLVIALALFCAGVRAETNSIQGFSLTETWHRDASATTVADKYDAQLNPALPKTDAQKVVDWLFERGVRRINLFPQANMRNPKQSSVKPNAEDIDEERTRITRLIKYIHSKGGTVGIRPSLFVLSPSGDAGYTDPTGKYWWHGNIQPRFPETWFEHYRNYLALYYPLGKEPGVVEFTIGAELYSMTVGLEAEWPAQPYGFPGQWVQILKEAKKNLPGHVKVMYDVNFTDELTKAGDLKRYGGEWARWVYRLTGFDQPDPALAEFWNGLDAIGIDNYRSLVPEEALKDIPKDYNELTDLLEEQATLYASQIGADLDKISRHLRSPLKHAVLKEIGYSSSDRGFYEPFLYEGKKGEVNLEHQAAAYEATMRAFWAPKHKWMDGIVFWDASINHDRHKHTHPGFSVIGKPPVEAVLHRYWR